MKEFPYRALDAQGWPQRGTVTAEDWAAAVEALQEEGLSQIAPDTRGGWKWALKHEARLLSTRLEWKLLLRLILPWFLGAAVLAALVLWWGTRTLIVQGTYDVLGTRAPLTLSFVVDDRRVYPKPATTRLTPTSYSTRLRFFSLKAPQKIRVRLRMRGFEDISHAPVPIPKNAREGIRLPGLRLVPKGTGSTGAKSTGP